MLTLGFDENKEGGREENGDDGCFKEVARERERETKDKGELPRDERESYIRRHVKW